MDGQVHGSVVNGSFVLAAQSSSSVQTSPTTPESVDHHSPTNVTTDSSNPPVPTASWLHGLEVLLWNAWSIVNKLGPFQSYIYFKEFHIIAPWYHPNVYDKEILPVNYTLYRNDRDSRGGGVSLTASALNRLCLLLILSVSLLKSTLTSLLLSVLHMPILPLTPPISQLFWTVSLHLLLCQTQSS